MQVKFSYREGTFPYHAEYIGYEGPPILPRLGLENKTGQDAATFGYLLQVIVQDLAGCPEKTITPTFSYQISPELQETTRLLFDLLVKNNSIQGKLERIAQALHE